MVRITQQINLYQPIFRKKPTPFSLATMGLTLAVVILLLVSIQGFGLWQRQRLAAQLNRAANSHAELKKQVLTLEQKLPAPGVNQQLQVNLDRLIDAKTSMLELERTLISRIDGNSQGFAAYFEGFARKNPQGLWLKTIQLEQGGDFLALEGEMTRPELVPMLLQQLRGEQIFSGKTFQDVRLFRIGEEGEEMGFRLQTAAK